MEVNPKGNATREGIEQTPQSKVLDVIERAAGAPQEKVYFPGVITSISTTPRSLIDGGDSIAEVAKRLHVSRATLYRALDAA